MNFSRKIDKANHLLDEIEKIESQYKVLEHIPKAEFVRLYRMQTIVMDMTIKLIKAGAWSKTEK